MFVHDVPHQQLEVMEQMSGNVSSEFEFLEGQVGVMADRIVGTECAVVASPPLPITDSPLLSVGCVGTRYVGVYVY